MRYNIHNLTSGQSNHISVVNIALFTFLLSGLKWGGPVFLICVQASGTVAVMHFINGGTLGICIYLVGGCKFVIIYADIFNGR